MKKTEMNVKEVTGMEQLKEGKATDKGSVVTMEEFVNRVKEMITKRYADCVVDTCKVTKNNGLKRTGITIMEKNSNIAPNIYLDIYYEQYKAGMSLGAICNEITVIYEDNKKTRQFDVADLRDFDTAKVNICYRLVNAERNVALLKTIPHRLYQDLAVIYYIMVSKNEETIASAIIKNELMKAWNTDEELLYELARENTPKLLKGCVNSMSEVLKDIMGDTENEENSPFDVNISEDDIPMYVASNVNKTNGAVTMLYDGILADFSKKIGGNFYILPSSVHEILFVPAQQNMVCGELVQMVREVNATQVEEEEILSDNIYYYHADTRCIEMMK